MHPALRKGPLFLQKTPPIFHLFHKTPPFHFLPTCLAFIPGIFFGGTIPAPNLQFFPNSYQIVCSKSFFGQDSELQIYHGKLSCSPTNSGVSVAISVLDLGAEGPGFKSQSRRRFRQTVHTHCASVHQAAKLVAALLRVARITAGLVESNGSLPPGL